MPKETSVPAPEDSAEKQAERLRDIQRKLGLSEADWCQWEEKYIELELNPQTLGEMLDEIYLDGTAQTIKRDLGMPEEVWAKRVQEHGPMLLDFYAYRKKVTNERGLPEYERKVLRDGFVSRWSQPDRQKNGPIFAKMSEYVGSNESRAFRRTH